MRFTAPGLPKEFRDRQQAIAPGRVLTWGRTADGVAVGTIGVLAVLGDEDEAIARVIRMAVSRRVVPHAAGIVCDCMPRTTTGSRVG